MLFNSNDNLFLKLVIMLFDQSQICFILYITNDAIRLGIY